MIPVSETKTLTSAGLIFSPAPISVCLALGEIVTGGIDIHRCLAAKALGRLGDPAATPFLIKALLDEDEDVRTDAAEALLALADPARPNTAVADQLFENLLGDPCSEVKLAAIETLAKLQDARVVPWLRRMVKGRDEEIAWDEEEFLSSGWDDWVEIQVRAITALADMGADEAVPDVVAAIFDENAQDMTETAFKALAKMGPEGVHALAGFLGQKQTRLRRRAAAVLAGLEGQEALELQALALEDPAAEVRLAALNIRGRIAPDDPSLTELLDDANPEIRLAAIRLFGANVPEKLRVLIDDPSGKVAATALRGLAISKDISADDILIEKLCRKINGEDSTVSVAAAGALVVIAPELAQDELIPVLNDLEQSVEKRLGALKALVKVGSEPAIAALVAVIDDEERQIRLETMTALADLAGADSSWPNLAGTALIEALRGNYDPEPVPEEEAVALAEEQVEEIAPEAVEAPVEEPDKPKEAFPTSTLDSMLNDAPGLAPVAGLPEQGIELTKADMERLAIAKNVIGKKKISAPVIVRHEDIRRFAARVVGDLNHPEIVSQLSLSLAADDAELRLAAADSLSRIGARGFTFPTDITQVLLDNLVTEDRRLKLLLIRSLSHSSETDVQEILHILLRDPDSFIRRETVISLSKMDGFASEKDDTLQGLLQDSDPAVRTFAAKAVAAMGKDTAVGQLVEFSFSHEGYHGREAAKLLRRLDPAKASVAYLNTLKDDERKRIWSVAIEALDELNSQQNTDRGT